MECSFYYLKRMVSRMTEQAKFIEVLENPMQYIKIDSQGLCDVDVTIELWTAMQYAITACKAMEQAGEVLPEKTKLPVVRSFNACLDEICPAFARVLQERDEAREKCKNLRIGNTGMIDCIQDVAHENDEYFIQCVKHEAEIKDLKAEVQRLKGERKARRAGNKGEQT